MNASKQQRNSSNLSQDFRSISFYLNEETTIHAFNKRYAIKQKRKKGKVQAKALNQHFSRKKNT
jgi:hypothetical protein